MVSLNSPESGADAAPLVFCRGVAAGFGPNGGGMTPSCTRKWVTSNMSRCAAIFLSLKWKNRNERNAHCFSSERSNHAAFDDQVVAGGCGVRDLKVERFVFWEDFVEQITNLIGAFEVELETRIYKCCVSRVELRQPNGILCFVSRVKVANKCVGSFVSPPAEREIAISNVAERRIRFILIDVAAGVPTRNADSASQRKGGSAPNAFGGDVNPLGFADIISNIEVAAATTARSTLPARHLRQRSGQELLQAKEALERKTEELAYSLSMMRATLESTTDAIVVTDLAGNLTGFNEKYAQMLGLSQETINSSDAQQLREIFSRQFKDPERFLARVMQIYTSSPPESFDILEFADGRVFERYSKTQLIDNRSVGRVWSFRDVTERNSAEIIYQRLAAIVDSSDDAIVGKDLNGIVTTWNSGAERLFGYSANQMIGTSIMRLIPPGRQAEENEILTRIRNGQRVDHFETVRVRKDGQLIDVSVTISPIKDVTGNVMGASKVARDIGERKRGEEKLQAAKIAAEKASKAKDDFLALLSHELRTPLTPALVAASYLAEHEDLLPEFREEVTAIWRNVQLEAHLIDDLLDVTRITRGKIEMHHEAVDVHRLLHTAVQIAQNDILEKQIELAIDLRATNHHIWADPVRIQQVFWNLLNNAVKFTPKEGRITICSSNEERQFVFEITDTGIGIEVERQRGIFEAFDQGEPSITRQFGGLGLGLTISKTLLDLHGGRITVQSEGKNRGTTFRVFLDLLREPSFRGRRRAPGRCRRRSDRGRDVRPGRIRT